MERIPTGALVVVPAKDDSGFYWHAKFRVAGVQKRPRLGRAWIEARKSEAPDAEGWQRRFRKRRGHAQAGYLTAADAELKMREVIAEAIEVEREMRHRKESPSFEFVAELWLAEHGTEADLKGTTRRNYGYMLRRANSESKPRGRKPKSRIMSAFQGRDIRSISAQDINVFLRSLRSDPQLGARSVNVPPHDFRLRGRAEVPSRQPGGGHKENARKGSG